MGTFITDRLQQLNNDLVQLFNLDRQQLIPHRHQASQADAGPSNTSDTRNQGSQDTVQEQSNATLINGLKTSIGALNLGSGNVPPLERVILEIKKVQSLFSSSPIYHRGGGEVSKLEHLFLATCTIAVYLNLLDIILNATLPLANEITYWQSLLDNRSWRCLYVVQTSPYRLFSMTRSVIRSTREHLDSLIETTEEAESQNRVLQLIKYFPTFLRKYLIAQPVSFPLAIRYEITFHRKQLQRIREYQAECLGLLAEQGLSWDPEQLEDSFSEASSPSTSLTGAENSNTERAEKYVQEHISKTLCLMGRVLDKATKDTRHLTDPQQHKVPSRRAARSLTILGSLHGVANLGNDESLNQLKKLIRVGIPQYVDQIECQTRQFDRPSWLARIWIPALIGYFGIKYGLRYISEHRADLNNYLEDAWETVRRFVTDWVWEPSVRIMTIIRHSDSQGSLQMLGNESLNSDIASLERMVLDFGEQHYKMDTQDLGALSQAVRNGDISAVMRAYEQELKTPLKGALIGNLIQTFLIQIQKTKVDVEVAMAALDKLLKANELNFAFLAVGPSLLLLWGLSAQGKRTWQRASGHNVGLVAIQMRNSLRQVERLLNLASAECDGHQQPMQRPSESMRASLLPPRPAGDSPLEFDSSLTEDYDDMFTSGTLPYASSSVPPQRPISEPLSNSLQLASERLTRIRARKGKVPYKTQGLILCEVHLLRTFATRLTRHEGLRDKVMEDLREIEESSLTVHQRLRTTERMYRTYGFLGLHQH
ncbi:ATP synthase regulation protein NCA2-domain-containing protein [Mortierella sp. GBAus27b]|nr:Nuclear control of ATPase protein 2 [Mortierella sp. GBA43]KAI8353075.1 ATP synthase regulation protein NCA2-domain-containing protein [Mortierella sp. GBAus27b]